jgi:peptide/nickel transport system permease protein
MGSYILRRIIVAFFLVIGAATLVFALMRAVPGDPVVSFLGEYATSEQIEAVRHELGLDRPILVQYVNWLFQLVQGDFGQSLVSQLPVRQLILDTILRSAELVVIGILIGLAAGIPLGVVSALRRAQPTDIGITVGSLTGLSLPTYVSGTLLVLLLAVQWQWLPSSGYVSFLDDPIQHVKLLIMPSLTLGINLTATIARFTRASVLDVLHHDYVRTARSKGLHERHVVRRHVLRTSLLPVTTIVGLQAGHLIGGLIIIETIFAWPGLATLLFTGIHTQDYPVVQGCVVVICGLFILINLAVDVLNGIIDPRVSQGAKT